MLRSPYRSPDRPPPRERAKKFLRLPPPESRKIHPGLWILALVLLGCLVWSFVGSDTGVIRAAALKRENSALEKRKLELASRVETMEQRRKEQARDPLLEERVARERFHLVKKDEVIYRYKDAEADSAR
ncbi:MAG TPA: septum formation initiator family protein [Candidatus Limnocylindrales bacterium]|nr:septum formation initiator family protein [Candidatus Limnocylindrales bacterium]